MRTSAKTRTRSEQRMISELNNQILMKPYSSAGFLQPSFRGKISFGFLFFFVRQKIKKLKNIISDQKIKKNVTLLKFNKEEEYFRVVLSFSFELALR